MLKTGVELNIPMGKQSLMIMMTHRENLHFEENFRPTVTENRYVKRITMLIANDLLKTFINN